MSTVTKSVSDAAQAVGDHFASDFESLRKDFGQLRSDVSELLGHAKDAGKSGMSRVRDQAYEAAGKLKNQGANSLEAIGDEISDYPMTGVLMVFGIGFIVAKLMSRK